MDMSIAADCYDVRAWAPVVPVIPDQEEKADFGDKPFYIAVRIVPLESVVTFDPTEFAISVEGIDGPLMPIEIDDSLGDRNLQHPDANYSRQWVYGWQRYYWMSFDIRIEDVHRYTLIPGIHKECRRLSSTYIPKQLSKISAERIRQLEIRY